MSKPQSIYMWENVDNTIQRIDPRIELIPKKYLYDPQYCSKENEDFSVKYFHIIGEFVQVKNHLILCIGLNYTVNPLMDVYLG